MRIAELRKALHDVPGAAGDEGEAAALLRQWLADQGLEPIAEKVAGHGLIYRVVGKRSGPARLWRAELDALPSGHRCGHDGHMAMLAGALARLEAAELKGTVTALFQPSEETGEGMQACLSHAELKGPFDEALAFHNIPGTPLGQVILGPGAWASTGVRIHFKGREAHAADPHAPGDVWPDMAACIEAIRGLEPEAGAGTVVHVRLGQEAFGTRPGHGIVSATLRGWAGDVTGMEAVLAGHGDDRERVEPFPETRNDNALMQRLMQRLEAFDVERSDEPFAWSEDFGHAIARWPGAMVGLGAGEDQAPLHDNDYEFPDALIDAGIKTWLALVGP